MATTGSTSGYGPEPPRDMAFYEPTDHFHDRVECDRRPVELAHAAAAVEAGRIEDNPVDRDVVEWRFRQELDGIDVVVPAGRPKHGGRGFRIFTCYADLADARVAIRSNMWSRDDVHVAALLQYLNGERDTRNAGLHANRIHVTETVPYHGHRIINKDGYSLAVCVDCKHETNDGQDYRELSCRK